jgi:metal-responsive CopG/Arc/MetJ family transcriptional regulator
MKTAVSIPDDIFERAEDLVRRSKRSRSELYANALSEYVARHASDPVTEAMNRVVAEIGETKDRFLSKAARRTLEKSEW